nr:MAG TPA: hypothetical protein [Caudoviricetes sp.]DAQ57298.1 MAG TPA: hypothetical protein [Bacteriophage sp.]
MELRPTCQQAGCQPVYSSNFQWCHGSKQPDSHLLRSHR